MKNKFLATALIIATAFFMLFLSGKFFNRDVLLIAPQLVIWGLIMNVGVIMLLVYYPLAVVYNALHNVSLQRIASLSLFVFICLIFVLSSLMPIKQITLLSINHILQQKIEKRYLGGMGEAVDDINTLNADVFLDAISNKILTPPNDYWKLNDSIFGRNVIDSVVQINSAETKSLIAALWEKKDSMSNEEQDAVENIWFLHQKIFKDFKVYYIGNENKKKKGFILLGNNVRHGFLLSNLFIIIGSILGILLSAAIMKVDLWRFLFKTEKDIKKTETSE